MRSGLWILLTVILAGILVGSLLKGRLGQPEETDDLTDLREIASIEEPETKIAELERFIADYRESEYRPDAYYMISGAMLNDLGDTTGMIAFAEKTLEEESDPETRALMYYRLYRATAETQPDEAYLYANRLAESDLGVGWVYNYIAYNYAERGKRLGIALKLSEQAILYAESADDSSSYLDTRGWLYYQMKEYAKALADLEKAARMVPEPSDEILGHLGQAQLKSGRPDEAFETFRALLVMGEYPLARENIHALMERKDYTAADRKAFEEGVWAERYTRALTVEPFTLPALHGGDYTYRPEASAVSIINFFGPT